MDATGGSNSSALASSASRGSGRRTKSGAETGSERRKRPAVQQPPPSAATPSGCTPSAADRTPKRKSPRTPGGASSLKSKRKRTRRRPNATITLNTTEEVDVTVEKPDGRPAKPRTEAEKQVEAAFGYLIPSSHFEVKTITFPKIKKLGTRMTRSCMILKENQETGGQLRFGDVVLSINEKRVHSKKNFSQQLRDEIEEPKATKLTIQVARVRCSLPAPPSRFAPAFEVLSGFSYHVACIYRIPGVRVALSIKSYNEKVYVTKVREETSAWMSVKQGDALIDLNGELLTSVDQVEKGVRKLLRNNFVSMLVERPEDPHALQFVRMVLNAERSVLQDFGLAMDVREICQKERKKVAAEWDLPPPKSILRAVANVPAGVTCESPKRAVQFAAHSEDVPIACEANPKLLAPVPSHALPNFSLKAYDPLPPNSPLGASKSPLLPKSKRKSPPTKAATPRRPGGKRKKRPDESVEATQEIDRTQDRTAE